MIHEILTASGIPYRESRFLHPPAATYAVTFDDQEVDGPDSLTGTPCIVRHDITVELYEPKPDPDAEFALESALRAWGLSYTKQARYWLQNVQRHQIIYEFSYIEKRRA